MTRYRRWKEGGKWERERSGWEVEGCKFMTETMGPYGGHYMEGMGLKFNPVIGKHLLCHSSMFGPMTGTFLDS